MTRPTLGEMRQGAIVRTADDEEMIIVNPTEGEVLRLGHCFVSYDLELTPRNDRYPTNQE